VKFFDFSVRRPVAVMMIVLAVIVLGGISYSRLGMDLFPEMELPMLLVQTTYRGAGPQEVEDQITRPLEGAIGTVSGVQNLTSYSMRGSSLILAEFNWGADLNYATNQLRDRLDMYGAALPSDATKPTIIKMDPSAMPIMQVALYGPTTLEELTAYAEDTVQARLERIEGIASVDVSGSVTEEIRIVVDPQRLLAYGVSMNQISALLYQENTNATGGSIEEGMKEYAVRITGEFRSLDDIRDLQVSGAYGGYIPLGSLADVERIGKDRTSYVFIDGEPGITFSLMKQSDANLVQTSSRVRETLTELGEELPAGYEMTVAFDQADYINQSLSNVVNNGLTGAILAVLILFIFLRSWRSTLIIAISIPVSIIATFAMMFFTDVSLNLVSLGGLALGLGMMVDNSIVILENIFRFRQEEKQGATLAAIEGSKEVAGAVAASTITTVVVFMPIVFVEGLASQIFRQMALTITCSLLASLAVAFMVVPMLSNKLLVVEKTGGPLSFLSRGVEKLLDAIRYSYGRFLGGALRHKGLVALLTLAAFIGCLFLLPQVGMEFIPGQDTGEYSVSVDLPRGTALHETLRVAQQVEDILRTIPENQRVTSSVGGGGGNFGLGAMGGGNSANASFSGSLLPLSQRERGLEEVLEEIRVKLRDIPGADIDVTSSGTMVFTASDIQINLLGDDLEQLSYLAEAVAREVEMIEDTREVTTSLENGSPEVNVIVDRQKAAQYGLNSSTVAAVVSTAVNGSVPTKYREGGRELDIRLVMDEQYRQNLNDLAALTVTSPNGSLIPLGNIAALEIDSSPTNIIRQNQSRQVSISCSVVNRSLAEVSRDVREAVTRMNLPPEVALDFGGSNAEMEDAFSDLMLALILAVALVYMVMAFQFEQLLYPFVIMFALPPTFIGVILGLYLTGRTINVVSLIGVIMLAGIVVNNAIVLVDYINVLRREKGMAREEAIVLAGETRLRPILMTTLTTILGMLPIAIGGGEGGEMTAPMGTVVFFGLSFSTLITLVLVPCMYIYAENIANWIGRLFRRKAAPEGAAATAETMGA
jgi:HAE1 family hydrophobic/amphiphilic exporter-1